MSSASLPHASAAPESALRAVRLTVNDQSAPRAVDRPVFGWQLDVPDLVPAGAALQGSYRVEVSAVDGTPVWDSGRVPGSRQSYVAYDGPALEPDHDYSVRVQVWDTLGHAGPWSRPARFGVGLDAADWKAEWIRRPPGGRAPVELIDGVLRIASGGTVPLPVPPLAEFEFETELRLSMGATGILLGADGSESSGCLLRLSEYDGVSWTAGGEAGAEASRDADGGPAVRIETDRWYRLTIAAEGTAVSAHIDGKPVARMDGRPPGATSLAFVHGPREQTEFRRLRLSSAGRTVLEQDFASAPAGSDPLSGWATTTAELQADEWTLVRGNVEPSGRIVRARLYVAACHEADLRINGRPVGRATDFSYPGEGYYRCFDVTDLLPNGGTTVIAALQHWYGPGQGRAAGEPALLVHLSVQYEDGSRETFGSGPSWRVHEGPYRQSGYRNNEGDPVEHFDAAAFIPGWDEAGFDDAAWAPAVTLGRHPVAPLVELRPRETHLELTRRAAKGLLSADDGTLVADFGAVVPARPSVSFRDGVRGRTVNLRGGYNLDRRGRVATARMLTQNTDMSLPVTQQEGPWQYEAFTHLGLRYLEIPGVTATKPGDVAAVVVHAEHPDTATAHLTTSDHTLNQVFRLLRDSALFGVQEQFVDTPTREKGQFLADAVNISYATMTLFGERAFTRQALREFAASGRRYWSAPEELGRSNAVYPNGDGKRDIPDFSLQLVEWAESYYRHTGDLGLLRELYPALRNVADYALRNIPATGPTAGLVTDLDGGSGPYLHGIVDWPVPGRFGYDMECAARTTVNAQACSALSGVARIAALVDAPAEDAASYGERAEELARTINARLRPAGRFVDGLHADGTASRHTSQHATSFPLAAGITEDRFREEDGAWLASLGMQQGPMTVHRLFRALLAAGRTDAVLDLLTNRDQPGWARIVDAGGSFTWEAWELAEGTDYSQSHAWSAAVLQDVIEGILGVTITLPGAEEVLISPPVCSLSSAAGAVPTQRGIVSVSWTRDTEGLTLTATVPAGMSARVALPGRPATVVTAGTHVFRAAADATGTGATGAEYSFRPHVLEEQHG